MDDWLVEKFARQPMTLPLKRLVLLRASALVVAFGAGNDYVPQWEADVLGWRSSSGLCC